MPAGRIQSRVCFFDRVIQFAIAVENKLYLDAEWTYHGVDSVLGPYTVNGDAKLAVNGFDVDGLVTEHTDNDYLHRDIGLIAGFSIEHPLGPFFSFRYYRGLTPIETKDKQGPLPDGWSTKTYYSMFQISLGYFFGLSKPSPKS